MVTMHKVSCAAERRTICDNYCVVMQTRGHSYSKQSVAGDKVKPTMADPAPRKPPEIGWVYYGDQDNIREGVW
jgi:hypothetical protein